MLETAFHVAGELQLALIAGGAALFCIAVLTDGALGALRLVPRSAHRVLDIVVVGGLAASPLIVRGQRDVAGIIVAEAVAIVLLRLILSTRYVPVATPAGLVVDAASRPADSSPRPTRPAGGASPEAAGPEGRPRVTNARVIGVLVGQKVAERRGPEAEARRQSRQRALEATARRFGNAVGRRAKDD